ncbi:hypothetical protein PIB30_024245 [Stylosanthes scabra]|uniref:Uncharacterized protein n=1 Tax=Stylosanthes scabra TaxID=79078 RepID=A0ABU6T9G1_9FABA|nr:hypothetical protein [Stylosanthes scabra]
MIRNCNKVGGIGDTSGGHVESTGSTPRRRRHIPSPSGSKKKARPVEDTNFKTTARSVKVQELPRREAPNRNIDVGGSAKSDTEIGFVPVYGTPEAIPRENGLAMVVSETPTKSDLMEIPTPSFSLRLTLMQIPSMPRATPITEKHSANNEPTESADEDLGVIDVTIMLTDETIEACKGPMNGFFPVISQKLGEGKNCVAGVLLKDLAAYVDNNGPFNGDCYDCGYEQVNGKQPNTWDFGVYVLKWMQMWDPKSLGVEVPPLPEWDNDELRQFRKELVMDMLYCAENESNDSLEEAIKLSQRRVENRGKKIHLKDSWTNPRTKSLVRRAERAPKGKQRMATGTHGGGDMPPAPRPRPRPVPVTGNGGPVHVGDTDIRGYSRII